MASRFINHAINRKDESMLIQAPQIIPHLATLKANIQKYPHLGLEESKILEYADNPSGLFKALNIDGYDDQEIDTIAVLERINTALPLRAEGLLPSRINITQISTLRDDFTKQHKQIAIDASSLDQQKVQRKLYKLALKTPDIAEKIKVASFEEGWKEFEKLLTAVSIKVAPQDIDTVKLINRESEGKGYEIWVPMNRLENALGRDGEYGLRLRSVGRLELRHEILGHLFGAALGVPLGESRDAMWGYNATEWFASTFSAMDVLEKEIRGNIITPDEVSYIHALAAGINPARNLARSMLFSGKLPFKEKDSYINIMRSYYFAESTGRYSTMKDLGSDITAGFRRRAFIFPTRSYKTISNQIRTTLMKNEGTTPLKKEWMNMSIPSLGGLYPSHYFASLYPQDETGYSTQISRPEVKNAGLVINKMQTALKRADVELKYNDAPAHDMSNYKEGVYISALANGSEREPGRKIYLDNRIESAPSYHAKALVHDGHHAFLEKAETQSPGYTKKQLVDFQKIARRYKDRNLISAIEKKLKDYKGLSVDNSNYDNPVKDYVNKVKDSSVPELSLDRAKEDLINIRDRIQNSRHFDVNIKENKALLAELNSLIVKGSVKQSDLDHLAKLPLIKSDHGVAIEFFEIGRAHV